MQAISHSFPRKSFVVIVSIGLSLTGQSYLQAVTDKEPHPSK
jgi:hypothetical protein